MIYFHLYLVLIYVVFTKVYLISQFVLSSPVLYVYIEASWLILCKPELPLGPNTVTWTRNSATSRHVYDCHRCMMGGQNCCASMTAVDVITALNWLCINGCGGKGCDDLMTCYVHDHHKGILKPLTASNRKETKGAWKCLLTGETKRKLGNSLSSEKRTRSI